MLVSSLSLIPLLLTAQFQPDAQPPWFIELQKIIQERHQAPLGSLDHQVDQIWQQALLAPEHPLFLHAAQSVQMHYHSQGYHLRAEAILEQALQTVPADLPEIRWQLISALAMNDEMSFRFKKSLARREALLDEILASEKEKHHALPVLLQTASIHERMGEMEKAESAIRKLIELKQKIAEQQKTELKDFAGAPHRIAETRGSISHLSAFRGNPNIVSRSFIHHQPYPSAAISQNQLASFYARTGRQEEAEKIYRISLEQSEQDASSWNRAARDYVNFLQGLGRFPEALTFSLQMMERVKTLPDSQRFNPHDLQHQLVHLYQQNGQMDQAIELQRTIVAESLANQDQNSYMGFSALQVLFQLLLQNQQLDEAEKVLLQLDSFQPSDSNQESHFDQMKSHLRASILQARGKTVEAQKLRPMHSPHPSAPGNEFLTQIEKTRGKLMTANPEEAAVEIDNILQILKSRTQIQPHEIQMALSLIHTQQISQSQEIKSKFLNVLYELLMEKSDHPQVVEAFGDITTQLYHFGMREQAEEIIRKQQKVITDTSGPDSYFLNQVNRRRASLHQLNQQWDEAIAEHQKILERTDKLTGVKSMEGIQALQGLASAYIPAQKWSEEQQVFTALQERIIGRYGVKSRENVHWLTQIANRLAGNQQFAEAGMRLDEAEALVATLPEKAYLLQTIQSTRSQLNQMKDLMQNQQAHPQFSDQPYTAPHNPSGGVMLGVPHPWFNSPAFVRDPYPRKQTVPVAPPNP